MKIIIAIVLVLASCVAYAVTPQIKQACEARANLVGIVIDARLDGIPAYKLMIAPTDESDAAARALANTIIRAVYESDRATITLYRGDIMSRVYINCIDSFEEA